MAMVKNRIVRIKENIARICRRIGKEPGEITLVGVTKFASIEMINAALVAGLTHIGENKVQEALKKFPALDPFINQTSLQVTRHMIGHLQTNKVRQAVKIFDMIQSVDSLKVAEAINRAAEKNNRRIDVLVQVNAAGDIQKYGIRPDETLSFIGQMAGLAHLNILGLMTIAPFSEDDRVMRPCFQLLKRQFDQIKLQFADQPGVNMKYLSMGMTHDYEMALEEGANMVRIGRAIFPDEE